jgi:hypothetical protein
VLGIIGAGAGIPPEMSNATSWSIAGSLVLLLGYVLAFAIAVGLVAWVDNKLSSRRLFREIYRELGIGRSSSSVAGPGVRLGPRCVRGEEKGWTCQMRWSS